MISRGVSRQGLIVAILHDKSDIVTGRLALDVVDLGDGVELVRTEGPHKLVVRLLVPMSIPEKGHFLLELERRLRLTVDDRIEVFLESMQDRNAARWFRGVKV